MPGNAWHFSFMMNLLMDESAVLKLISSGVTRNLHKQLWIDLGAGSGTFTTTLAKLLGVQSTVYAIDKDKGSLTEIVQPENGAKIITQVDDFMRDDFQIPVVDGILMANALHYVKDQYSFLTKIKDRLRNGGRLIIVEYDRSNSNPWVPFPVSFDALQKLATRIGISAVHKLGEIRSVYNNGMMCGALLV